MTKCHYGMFIDGLEINNSQHNINFVAYVPVSFLLDMCFICVFVMSVYRGR